MGHPARSGYFSTFCFNSFDVLAPKFRSPPYTAVIELVPTGRVEVMKLAEPLVSGPVPSSVAPFINETVSPSGGGGVTVAVRFTASPSAEGFGEDDSVVVVAAADGFTSNTTPSPPVPPLPVAP